MFNFVRISGGFKNKFVQAPILKLTSDKLKRQAQANRRDNMKKITKKEIRDYATKYFDEWLNDCPCEHIIIKPSMNTKDSTIVIEFDFMRAVEVD